MVKTSVSFVKTCNENNKGVNKFAAKLHLDSSFINLVSASLLHNKIQQRKEGCCHSPSNYNNYLSTYYEFKSFWLAKMPIPCVLAQSLSCFPIILDNAIWG